MLYPDLEATSSAPAHSQKPRPIGTERGRLRPVSSGVPGSEPWSLQLNSARKNNSSENEQPRDFVAMCEWRFFLIRYVARNVRSGTIRSLALGRGQRATTVSTKLPQCGRRRPAQYAVDSASGKQLLPQRGGALTGFTGSESAVASRQLLVLQLRQPVGGTVNASREGRRRKVSNGQKAGTSYSPFSLLTLPFN